MSLSHPTAVLITGGSSGIGRALALSYAGHGTAIHLSGRDKARVEAVAAECRERGAVAEGRVIDVTDAEAMVGWIADADARTPLDLVIANAGITNSTSGLPEGPERTRRILAVNIDGVVNTVLPALAAMDARDRGQVAIVASVAGFRGLPTSSAYSASKAAVKAWGEALRGERLTTGVRVNVICPGWVESRISENNRFDMPFLMTADRAAAAIRRGLARDTARIVFPWQMHMAVWLLAALPPAWTDPILNRYMAGREW
ncbi:MAG: short-chain dehydrogenase [Rhodospirillales bacterium CG15_BIG_FIL_POST_REV_8_21_14_020_66_15]|nr:MAG: short-chain dehydrogenase [Rhodospirillales bacterium CG15_BIG_FIL_POST_REV_8_21_14_020_66_15]